MLDESQIRDLVQDMYLLQQSELSDLDRIYEFMSGTRGLPRVPEGAEREIEDLARLSLKNVLPLVRDAFVQNLCVIGYRTALAKENDPSWKVWQANRMDARQVEVYRPAVTYGASYVTVVRDGRKGVFCGVRGVRGSCWRCMRTRKPMSGRSSRLRCGWIIRRRRRIGGHGFMTTSLCIRWIWVRSRRVR